MYIQSLMKFVPEGQLANKSTLIGVMARRLFLKPMMAKL